MLKKFVSVFALLLALAYGASGEPAKAARGKVLTAPSIWKEVFFRVSRCLRLPGDRVMICFHIARPPGGTGSTLIYGDGPKIKEVDLGPDGEPSAVRYVPPPYFAAGIRATDTATGQVLKPAKSRSGDPYPGEDSTSYALRPDDAVELGIILQLPKPVDQEPIVLNLKIPQSTREIEGLPVANKEGVNTIGKKFRVISADEENQ